MGDIGVPVGWYDEILRNPYGIRTPAVRCIVYELVRCGTKCEFAARAPTTTMNPVLMVSVEIIETLRQIWVQGTPLVQWPCRYDAIPATPEIALQAVHQ